MDRASLLKIVWWARKRRREQAQVFKTSDFRWAPPLGGDWAQDELSIRGTDRANSPQVRKKASPNGVASLGASRADSLRHFKTTISQI